MKKYIFLVVCIISCFLVIGCNGKFFGPGMADFTYKLSGNYKLYKAGTASIVRTDTKAKIIGDNIIGIAWDDNFILAKQELNKKVYYWILDIKRSTQYGPLSDDEFSEMKKELKIDSKYKFEKPEKYKNLDESNK